jgi:alpha-tubulin suppressor-like RCC1 family protein
MNSQSRSSSGCRAFFAALACATPAVVAACGIDSRVLTDIAIGGNEQESGTSSVFPAESGATTPVTAVDVFVGIDFSCALGKGIPLCWGKNTFGMLGTNDTRERTYPERVVGGFTFDTLGLGANHACGIEHGSGGRVLCWGDGASGQLGQGAGVGRTAPSLVPVVVPLPDAAIELAVGHDYSCVILRDGSLHCWGANQEGQLGDGSDIRRPTPIRMESDTDWLVIAAGQGHTCGIRRPGNLWCWGRNSAGQLGIGGPPNTAIGEDQYRIPKRVGDRTDWKHVELGPDAACGVTNDGALHCWGNGVNGNLGPERRDYFVPTRIGTRADWEKVNVDVFSTCGITRASELLCWGRNSEGQLGLSDFSDRSDPTRSSPEVLWASVSVGRFHTCGTTTSREIRCSGRNEQGQLGLNNKESRNVFTRVALPSELDPAVP